MEGVVYSRDIGPNAPHPCPQLPLPPQILTIWTKLSQRGTVTIATARTRQGRGNTRKRLNSGRYRPLLGCHTPFHTPSLQCHITTLLASSVRRIVPRRTLSNDF